jgi:GNAT superfamily N-acetyltransferase
MLGTMVGKSRMLVMTMVGTRFRIRPAATAQIDAIKAMQERSMRRLARPAYSVAAIESYLCFEGTLEDRLVAEGRLAIAIDDEDEIVGSAGWLRPVRGAEEGAAEPSEPVARILSVFVSPDHARQGIGRALALRTARCAAGAGAGQLRATATISAVPLFACLGYRLLAWRALVLPDGSPFRLAEMALPLAGSDGLGRGAGNAA